MPRYLSAIPAYGRDYKSKREVLADWNDGKDFLVVDMVESGYISKNDKPADVVLQVRYKKQTMVCVIK